MEKLAVEPLVSVVCDFCDFTLNTFRLISVKIYQCLYLHLHLLRPVLHLENTLRVLFTCQVVIIHPRLVLVAQPLTEENYNTWSRSVIVALNAKNKVGFIDGSIKEPKDSSHPTYSSWKKCNNMVLSWLKVEIRIMVPKLAAANNVSTAIEVQYQQLLALLN